MADPQELELKLEFDPADRERLDTALPEIADGETDRLVSTYFDTPAAELRAAGYSLRVRRQGRQRTQTVKAARGASAGLFERSEWERRIKSDKPLLDAEAGPLAEAVGAKALARIKPLFVTDVERATSRVDRADGAVELAIDEGEIRAGRRAERLSELELELGGGSPQLLFDLARQLNERLPLRLGVRSKSERGYALAAGTPRAATKAEPILLDCDGDAGDAFRAIAQACMRHFRLNETLLLDSREVEPLHQARVALRRLRSAFSLYKPLLAEDGTAELLNAELRWLAAELGQVRNIDVLIPRCKGEARERLKAARSRTFAQVRSELASSRTRLLMIDLTAWLAVGDWRTRPPDPQGLRRSVLPFARDLLESRRERLKRRGKGLAGLDDAHRHKVRIEAKKLRYAAEFFGSLYAEGKARRQHKRFLDAIEALQDQLGELNDLVVGPEVLAKAGIDAKLPQSGKQRQKRLREMAEKACNVLMKQKCFWRT